MGQARKVRIWQKYNQMASPLKRTRPVVSLLATHSLQTTSVKTKGTILLFEIFKKRKLLSESTETRPHHLTHEKVKEDGSRL